MPEKATFKMLKSSLWYTASSILGKGLVFLTTPLFTRIMSKSDIGVFSNFTSWMSLLVIVCTFSLSSSINVAKYDFAGEDDGYISSNLIFGSIVTLLFLIITLINHRFWLDFFSFNELEYFILFIYLFLCPACEMFEAKNTISYNYKASAITTLVLSITSTITSLICVIVFNSKYEGRLLGYMIPLIIINGIVYFYLIKKGKYHVKPNYWKYSFMISFPIIWHSLANVALSSSDRIMINRICSPDDLALYSVAYSCSIVIQVLCMSLNKATLPWFFEKMNVSDKAAHLKASKIYFILFGFVVILFMLVAPELLMIMGGREYLEALAVIPPVMVAYVFQFVYTSYVNVEFFYKKQKWIALGTFISAILNIGLNIICIPTFGYVAAAYTTLVGYVALFIIHYIIVKVMHCNDYFDSVFVIKYLSFYVFMLLILSIIYKNSIIRYGLIVTIVLLITIILYKHRQEVYVLIKERNLQELFSAIENWIFPVKKNRG